MSLASERNVASARSTLFTASDLMAMDLPSVQQVVQGILYEGLTLFAGKPKMGKTWLMLALALAVALVGTALGSRPVLQGGVLYLALEDNKRRLQRRIEKLLAGQEAPAGLHFALDWPRLDKGGIEALDDFLGEHPGIKLVIGDTLARLKPRASGRRTQYDEDRDAVDELIPLAEKHRVAMALVHHLREMESDDPLDMIHGSAGLTGGVDSALVLKRQRGEADAYLFGDGRDFENPVELALKWNASPATWTILGDAEEYEMSEERRAILGVVKSTDKPLGPKAITERLNASGTEMKYGAMEPSDRCVRRWRTMGNSRTSGGGHTLSPTLQKMPDNTDNLT
jgi:AAA domain